MTENQLPAPVVTDEMVDAFQSKYREIAERCNWSHSFPAQEAVREMLEATLSPASPLPKECTCGMYGDAALEPLGAEFEAAWDKSIDTLYEPTSPTHRTAGETIGGGEPVAWRFRHRQHNNDWRYSRAEQALSPQFWQQEPLFATPPPGEPAQGVTEAAIRAELKRLQSIGDLVVYEMADDNGLDIDEYVELIAGVIAALAPPPVEPAQTAACPSCKGTGTIAEYVSDDMRPIEAGCDKCGGSAALAGDQS